MDILYVGISSCHMNNISKYFIILHRNKTIVSHKNIATYITIIHTARKKYYLLLEDKLYISKKKKK